MTNQRPPRPDPVAIHPRPARAPESDTAGTARVLAVAALVLAAVAIALTAWRTIAPASASCQTQAWDTTPKTEDLPADLDGERGPVRHQPQDHVVPRACAVGRHVEPGSGLRHDHLLRAGRRGLGHALRQGRDGRRPGGPSIRNDLGDGGFSAVDDSGATFLQLRHDKIVVYLAASGDATATEVDQLASAFDKALGGDGGAITPPTPVSSGDLGAVDSLDPGASDAAGSPAAPDLIARMPEKVGDVTLTSESEVGSDIPGIDGSRAILAALLAAGRTVDDLRAADAYDASGNSDLQVQVLTVDGMPIAKTKALVLDSWLSASGAGVTHDKVMLNGKEWERIDYHDDGPKDYVRTDGNDVIVITTSDPAVAEKAAAGIK